MTNSELERLAILAEECAEVQQIICKIIRHGFESYNPFDETKTTNRDLLERELGDLSFAVNFCAENEDINLINVRGFIDKKRGNIKKYLHHNKIVND